MLLLAGGLVAYKLTSSGAKPEQVEERAVAAPQPAAAPLLDNAPPPPPSEEELAQAEKPAEPENTSKTVKVPSGPPGCSGQCAGAAGGDLKAALASRAASARSCYNTALRRNATLEGKMTVGLRVGPSGAVCSVGINSNTLADPAVGACVSAQFRASKFPAPEGGCVDMAVPLNFTSKK